ncbi:MAG: chorismate mutase [Candidatus Micrarchaeota archaeon]|nr:chorismate mutase [Candidatus Micrarchaeota archaeon]
MKSFDSRINALRKRVDLVDSKIIVLLGKRFATVKRIKTLKKAAGKPETDHKREAAILSRVKAVAARMSIPPAAAEKIFSLTIKESKRLAKK